MSELARIALSAPKESPSRLSKNFQKKLDAEEMTIGADRLKECGFIRDDAEIAYSGSSKWWGEIGSFEICISEIQSPRRKEAK